MFFFFLVSSLLTRAFGGYTDDGKFSRGLVLVLVFCSVLGACAVLSFVREVMTLNNDGVSRVVYKINILSTCLCRKG